MSTINNRSLDTCIELDELIDPLDTHSISNNNNNNIIISIEDQLSNQYYSNLTPCSSTQTLLIATPQPFDTQNLSHQQQQQQHQTITLVLPDFTTRHSLDFDHLLAYIQSKSHSISSRPPPIQPQDISIHHLILYIFDHLYSQELAHTSAPPLQYLNQLKLLSMGKAYQIANAVDVSYPALLLPQFLLLPILQRCTYIQLIIIPSQNLLPFEMSFNTLLTKLINIQMAYQSPQGRSSSINVNTTLTISDYSVTYAEAMIKKFKRVRNSISSSSSSCSSSYSDGRRSSIQLNDSILSSCRSQSLPNSQISRSNSHTGSDTDVDDAKGIKAKSTGFKYIFQKLKGRLLRLKSVGEATIV